MNKKLLIIAITISIIYPFVTSASAVSVKPQKVEVESSFWQKSFEEVLVTNISDEPAIYTAYPDAYAKNIEIDPKEFRLGPGESQIVKVASRFWLNGKYEFDLSIVSRSLNSVSVTTAAGVKLPVVVNVTGWIFWLVVIILVVAISAVGYLVARKIKK